MVFKVLIVLGAFLAFTIAKENASFEVVDIEPEATYSPDSFNNEGAQITLYHGEACVGLNFGSVRCHPSICLNLFEVNSFMITGANVVRVMGFSQRGCNDFISDNLLNGDGFCYRFVDIKTTQSLRCLDLQ